MSQLALFTDPAVTGTCPACGLELRDVFTPGIPPEDSPPPLTVLDRETDETTEWWVAPGSDKPSPLHRCDCGEPIRPTGRRGRPATTCEQCEAAA